MKKYLFKEFSMRSLMDFIFDLVNRYGLGEIRFNPKQGIHLFNEVQLKHAAPGQNLEHPDGFLNAWNKNLDTVREVSFELFNASGVPSIKFIIDLDENFISIENTKNISITSIEESLDKFIPNEILQNNEAFKQRIIHLENELNSKNIEIRDLKESHVIDIDSINEKHKILIEELNGNIDRTENEKNSLNIQLGEVTTELVAKKEELAKRELKKIATNFDEQENIYDESAGRWFYGLFLTLSGVFLYTLYVLLVLNKGNFSIDTLKFYMPDIVFFFMTYFCIIQYAYYIRLRDDYALRKTLAQSYHNILDSSEDDGIKIKFLDKTTDILCSKINNDSKSSLSGHAVSDILEIAKNLSKK